MLLMLVVSAIAVLVGVCLIAVLSRLQKRNKKQFEANLQAQRVAQLRTMAAQVSNPQLRAKLFAEIAHVENEAKHESGV